MVPALFAAGDWSALIPILAAIIWLISQMVSAARSQQARKPQRRPGEMAERPPSPPPKPIEQVPGKPTTLNAEIEQFLKRAAGQRGERARREPAPPPKTVQRPPAKAAGRKPLGPATTERRDFDSVTSSVEKHMADRGFTQRAEHLADAIVRADQQMEEHLQKAFSRRVGTLGDPARQSLTPVTDAEPSPEAPRTSATAATLSAMLANPQSLKNAIILNEILTRPEHRW
jgi:hypothetical protein